MDMNTLMGGAPVAAPEPAPEATPPPVETAPPAEPKADPQNTARFAALAKKQKALFRQEQALKQKEQQIAQMEAKYLEFEESKTQGRKNPEEFLAKQLGMNYEEFVNWKLNGGNVTAEMEVKSVRQELQEFKQRQEEQAKLREQQTKEHAERQAQEAIESFKQEVVEFVSQNKDEYELTNMSGYQHMVYETIHEHWKRSVKAYNESGGTGPKPQVMSNKDAADMVEKYLEEQVEKMVTTSKRLGSRFTKAEQKAAADQAAKPAPQQGGFQPSKTLSNQATSSAPSMLPAKTEADRLARAMAALRKG